MICYVEQFGLFYRAQSKNTGEAPVFCGYLLNVMKIMGEVHIRLKTVKSIALFRNLFWIDFRLTASTTRCRIVANCFRYSKRAEEK